MGVVILKNNRIISLLTAFITAAGIISSAAVTNHINVKASAVPGGRLGGTDRYDTMSKIVDAGWKYTSDYAVVATGEDFPDALCAAPLAKKYNAPIILTTKDSLNSAAKSELQRLKVKTVFIVGGTGAVSQNTENQINELGITDIHRLAGATRYDTSEKIAEEIGSSSEAVVATGENFPDALSIAPIAAIKGMPILLTGKNEVQNEIKPYLTSCKPSTVYIVGGSGVISDSVMQAIPNSMRLAGPNRYSTNTAILNEFEGQLNLSTIYIATGENFPDALACSALAPISLSPMVLVSDSIDSSTRSYISANYSKVKAFNAVGGTSVVSYSVMKNIETDFNPVNYIKIDVPYVNQKKPVYAPEGCEGASMLMGLKYRGITNVSYKAFLDNMPKSPDNNPFDGFNGSPYDVEPGIFQSIFPDPLTSYSKRYRSQVTNISGTSSDDLKMDLDSGNPIVVYVTNRYFEAPRLATYNFGGKNYTIVDNMHVVLLTGYDDRDSSNPRFYVADPDDRGTYWISKAKFDAAYNCLKWAIAVR